MATPFERRIDRPTVCRDSPSIRNPRCYPVWPKGTCQDVRNYSGQIGHVDLRRDVWGVGEKARVQGLRPLLDRADVARIRNLKLLSQIAINALLAHYRTRGAAAPCDTFSIIHHAQFYSGFEFWLFPAASGRRGRPGGEDARLLRPPASGRHGAGGASSGAPRGNALHRGRSERLHGLRPKDHAAPRG